LQIQLQKPDSYPVGNNQTINQLLGNIFLWHGLISVTKLQELAVDGILNRYLLLSLQHAGGKHYENVVKCQAVSTV
jgi:hypothetical protein